MKKTQITQGHPYYEIHQAVTSFVDQKVAEIIKPEVYMDNVRKLRNKMLAESDWTQFSNAPLTAEQQAEWATYRQALRDITTTSPIVWPTKPR